MNTLKKFTDKKINIRKNTLGSKVLDDILFSFADADGTASVKLAPLCEEASKKAEILLERTLEDGYDKYIVLIEDDVTVYFTSEISKIYALYDIKANYDCGINCGVIYGRAICQMRGLKSYLPPKNEIDDFKRQIDLLLSLGYNTLTLELGGAMEYKSHPEINEGWVEYCQIFKEYSGKSQDVQRMYIYPKTSIHVETGGYDYLTQVQIKSIIDYCYDRHIEIIPETPCLSHADYLLYRHPELSEFADDLLPNNVCPSNEGYYELLFDILDEVVELFKPARINIGHDEAYVIGCCEKCRQKSAADIYAYEVTRIHDYLASKGVATMLWGDKVIDTWHGGGEAVHLSFDSGRTVNINGQIREVRYYKCFSIPEFLEHIKTNPSFRGWHVEPTYTCQDKLPKDLQISNWSKDGDIEYHRLGFRFIYGNSGHVFFSLFDLPEKFAKYGGEGFSVSNWGSTDYLCMQRGGVMYNLFFGSLAAWSDGFDNNDMLGNALRVSDLMYNFKNKDVLESKHLEITHSCDFEIEHHNFDCGYWIETEKYHIGDYEIDFEDGTSMVYPIIWGENIGPKQTSMNSESKYLPSSAIEPIGTAMIVFDGYNADYKIVIPADKNVKDIRLTKTDKCVGNITFTWNK